MNRTEEEEAAEKERCEAEGVNYVPVEAEPSEDSVYAPQEIQDAEFFNLVAAYWISVGETSLPTPHRSNPPYVALLEECIEKLQSVGIVVPAEDIAGVLESQADSSDLLVSVVLEDRSDVREHLAAGTSGVAGQDMAV